MFLCRSAKTLGKAFMTHGSPAFQVPANRVRNVTLQTLHKVHTSGAVSLTAHRGHVTHVNHTRAREDDQCTDWERRSVQSQSWRRDILTQQFGSLYGIHVTRNGLTAAATATGNAHFPSNIINTNGVMQTTRASSTAAATKQREAGEEQQAVSDKGDEPILKDTPSSPEKSSDPEPEEGKPNKTQQLKKVFKEYGAVGVSFHICISLMSLGMFYLLVSSGIDMATLLCKLGFSEAVVRSKMAAGTSTFVLAYAIHKLFAPVRISITLVSVPLIVRHFRKIGLFKTPPAAP